MLSLRTASFVVVVLLASVTASAQQEPSLGRCGDGSSNTKIHGCLDYPPPRSTITASYPMVIFGWTVNTEMLQQPAEVKVYQFGEPDAQGQLTLETMSRDDYFVYWRLARPDVLAWARTKAPISSEALGYAIVIKAGVLRQGSNVVTVQFTDPTALNPVGVNYQSVQITVIQ